MNKRTSIKSVARRMTPSPAMVVAVIALIVAVSGSAYAAATINGKNIKKGTVSSKQIKNNSVTGTDVKDSSLTGSDVKDGTIEGADIKSGVIPTITPPAAAVVQDTTDRTIPASLSFSDVPGMTTTFTAPAGTTGLLIDYSAECRVTSTAAAQYLTVQILVDGTEATPQEGASTQFCTTEATTADSGTNEGVSAAMQRYAAVGPGAHTVTVQATTLLLGTGHLDGQLLSVRAAS